MPTIQVPQYEMRVYSVVGLKLDGITPTVAITHIRQVGAGSAQFDGQTPSTGEVDPGAGALALDGQTPDAYVPGFAEPDEGSLVTFGTDAEFTNTGDMRLIMEGQQPDALDSADFPIVYPGVGSLGIDEKSPVRGFGLQLQGYTPSTVPNFVSIDLINDYSLDGLSIEVSKLTSVDNDAVIISGKKPELLYIQLPLKVSPQNAEADLLGLAPDLLFAGLAEPEAGAAQITGRKPDIYFQPPDKVLPQDGAATISGLAPDAVIAGTAYPGVGAVALGGLQPQLIPNSPTKKVSPQDGALATSGKQLGDILNGLPVPAGALTLVETAPSIGLQPRPRVRYLFMRGQAPTAELSGTKALIGTIIENTNATTDVPTNYQICDITGFKVAVDEPFVKDWRGYYSRKKSHTERHPQDFVKGVPENRHGSESPEPEDEFIDDLYPSGVTTDDL